MILQSMMARKYQHHCGSWFFFEESEKILGIRKHVRYKTLQVKIVLNVSSVHNWGNNCLLIIYSYFKSSSDHQTRISLCWKHQGDRLKDVPFEYRILDRENPTSQSHPYRFHCRDQRSLISRVSIKLVGCGSHQFQSFSDRCLFFWYWFCPRKYFSEKVFF